MRHLLHFKLPNKLIIPIIFVFGASLVMGTTDLYVPSMPSMAKGLGIDQEWIQFSVTAYFLGTVFVPLLYGVLADHKGRRYTLLLGLSIFVLASAICLGSQSIWPLLIGRFFQGFGGAAVGVVGFASLKDLYTKEEQAKIIAYQGMAIASALALAPALGGYIEVTLGWRYAFALIFGLSVLLITLVFFKFKETLDNTHPKPTQKLLAPYWTMLKSKEFMSVSLIYPPLFGSIFSWITVSPFYFIDTLGMKPDAFGLYSMGVVAGYPIGAFINSRLIPRVGLTKTLQIALGIMAFSTFLLIIGALFFSTCLEFIFLSLTLYVTGMGVAFATITTLSMSIFPKASGTSSAFLHIQRMGGAALGSYIGGVMTDNTLFPIALYFLCSLGVSISLYIYVTYRKFVPRD